MTEVEGRERKNPRRERACEGGREKQEGRLSDLTSTESNEIRSALRIRDLSDDKLLRIVDDETTRGSKEALTIKETISDTGLQGEAVDVVIDRERKLKVEAFDSTRARLLTFVLNELVTEDSDSRLIRRREGVNKGSSTTHNDRISFQRNR